MTQAAIPPKPTPKLETGSSLQGTQAGSSAGWRVSLLGKSAIWTSSKPSTGLCFFKVVWMVSLSSRLLLVSASTWQLRAVFLSNPCCLYVLGWWEPNESGQFRGFLKLQSWSLSELNSQNILCLIELPSKMGALSRTKFLENLTTTILMDCIWPWWMGT